MFSVIYGLFDVNREFNQHWVLFIRERFCIKRDEPSVNSEQASALMASSVFHHEYISQSKDEC
jgi:hypothetical protein